MTVHSSSRGRGTSLSRDDDDRDCVNRSLHQRMVTGYTCDGPQETTACNARDLLVEAAGAAYLWSNYYTGGAALGERTATSGTCWFVVKEQHSRG